MEREQKLVDPLINLPTPIYFLVGMTLSVKHFLLIGKFQHRTSPLVKKMCRINVTALNYCCS